jgi:uncharacterized protein YqjF (DUF2071 family)
MGFVHPALARTSHRAWPIPSEPWNMTQTWHDLLFAHWPVDAAILRPLIPSGIPLDLFAGQAWVGIVPFHMSGIRGRGIPAIPGLSRFPELNVRTYVTLHDKPGVFFFSLDAANRAAVWAARRFYHLPYFNARMSVKTDQENTLYASRREGGEAEFRASYGPIEPVQISTRGSLEHWLTERYCLYATHRGKVFRGEVHHQPWPLQRAKADITRNTMASAAGVALSTVTPLLHFARRLEVLIWPLHPVD